MYSAVRSLLIDVSDEEEGEGMNKRSRSPWVPSWGGIVNRKRFFFFRLFLVVVVICGVDSLIAELGDDVELGEFVGLKTV